MRAKTVFSALPLLIFVIVSVNLMSQPNVNEHDIKFANSTTATLVGEDGIILKTTNLGQSWITLNSGITNVLYGYSPLDENTALICGENGVILKTEDGGLTWNLITTPTYEHLMDVEFINSETALACGDNGTILYSDDGGESWELVNNVTGNNLKDIDFYDEYIGYIVGASGTLLRTNDGGRSFTAMDLSFSNADLNTVQALANKIIVAGDYQAIFISDNGGQSWHSPNNLFTQNHVYDIRFFNGNDGILVGENGMIMRTMNGGLSWYSSFVNISTPGTDFYSVSFADANNGICIGKNGTEVYTTDGGITWSENAMLNPEDPFISKATINLNNYPNPFNPSTVISYKITDNNSQVTLKIYDITGKQISVLYDGLQNAGVYNVKFDGNGLSSGTYFYKLTVNYGKDTYSEVKKMVLAK
jgi:photosystem II stability/assembly factor-like uncharacterized protein